MHPEMIAAMRGFIRIFEERAHAWVDIGGMVDQVFHVSNDSDKVWITLVVAHREYPKLCHAFKLAGYEVPDEEPLQLEEATATWPVVQIDFQFVSERLVRNACLRPSNPILCDVGIKEYSALWFVRTEDALLLQFLSGHGVIHETLQEIRHDSRKLEYVNYWAERIGLLADLNKIL